MKNLSPGRFAMILFVFSVILYGLLYFYFTQVRPSPMPLYYMIPLVYIFTVGTYALVVQTKNKNPRSFVYSYMLMSFGRLIMYGGFVFVYALAHREGAKMFALTFFVLYLLYTALEIRAVLNYFKEK